MGKNIKRYLCKSCNYYHWPLSDASLIPRDIIVPKATYCTHP